MPKKNSSRASTVAKSKKEAARKLRIHVARLYRAVWHTHVHVSLLRLEGEGVIKPSELAVEEMVRMCTRSAAMNLDGMLDDLNEITEALGISDISQELKEIDGANFGMAVAETEVAHG